MEVEDGGQITCKKPAAPEENKTPEILSLRKHSCIYGLSPGLRT
jgi:hypothetical protein